MKHKTKQELLDELQFKGFVRDLIFAGCVAGFTAFLCVLILQRV